MDSRLSNLVDIYTGLFLAYKSKFVASNTLAQM